MAQYENSFYNPRNNYSSKILNCEVEPINYKGFLIYERIKQTCFDVVKDGVCIGMYAGIESAKHNIDTKQGMCKKYIGIHDMEPTNCKDTVCELCQNDDKICRTCGEPIQKNQERVYDSTFPFHIGCREKYFE